MIRLAVPGYAIEAIGVLPAFFGQLIHQEDESDRVKRSIMSGPPGTAISQDIRGWRGGTPNTSDDIRSMTVAGYYAPWFRSPGFDTPLLRALYITLSPREQELCCSLVDGWGRDSIHPGDPCRQNTVRQGTL